jgi:hypothetical protein
MNLDPDIAYVSVILKELDIPLSVSYKRHRIAMQKAIYLAQRTGVDLGYRYSWYLNGPYCSKLADIYYKADAEKSQYSQLEADQNFKSTLSTAKDIITNRPAGADLTNWLEALVSLDFLITVNKRNIEEAKVRVRELKPHVSDLLDSAQQKLLERRLIIHATT